MMMDQLLLYKAAKMYYEENLSQVEISERLEISRPKVSRLLEKARKTGIVNIQIRIPNVVNCEELQQKLMKRFKLEHVLVVSSIHREERLNLENTVKQAAPFFQDFIRDGDKIGVAWGYTLLRLAGHLKLAALPDSVILQITGNLDNADSSTFAHEIVRYFSEKLGVSSRCTLPCPIIVENPIIVDLLLHDTKIANIVSQANKADVVFPNIGVVGQDNCLWRTGYITTEMMHELNKLGAVGCICSRFIDKNGAVIESSLNERTISLSIEALKDARHSFACVANENKVPPLLGCLRSGLVNVLAIDSNTAITLLEYSEQEI
jgi:deoxyribonucleoside regulator